MKTSTARLALCPVAVLGTGIGCARVRAKAAFKDGNKLYKEENFKKAIDEYENAIDARPEHGRGLLLPRQLPPGALPAGQGRPREQAAAGPGDRGLQEVARDQHGQDREPEEREAPTPWPRSSASTRTTPTRTTKKPRSTPSSSWPTTRTTPRTSTRWPTSTRSSTRSTRRRRSTRRWPSSNPKDAKACGALAALLQQAALGRAGEPWARGAQAAAREVRPRHRRARALRHPRPDRGRRATTRSRRFYWDKAYRDPAAAPTSRRTRTPTRASRPSTRRWRSSPTTWRPSSTRACSTG